HDVERLGVLAARAMRVVERARDLARDPEAQRRRELAPSMRHRRREVAAAQVLHRDEVAAALFAAIVDRDDGWMAQARGDLRFAHEELREVAALHQRGEHALDHDGLLKAGRTTRSRAPHLGHSAFGDAIDELVIAERDRPSHADARYQG